MYQEIDTVWYYLYRLAKPTRFVCIYIYIYIYNKAIFFIKVWLVDNVLVSGIQQSGSV